MNWNPTCGCELDLPEADHTQWPCPCGDHCKDCNSEKGKAEIARIRSEIEAAKVRLDIARRKAAQATIFQRKK